MFTPEELIGQVRGGGASDLGISRWLEGFRQQHLAACRHFELLFYDERLDIICESLEFADGAFTPSA